ncbi:hypothetical protein A2W14_02585 [Candidatus Gottesmanbacteria bacterium RBG_16_37_8]|uniref:Uncharacterized protein n=1 Tax=Candidatus Gottesmanbacteria bacterium RBG_16_37_8 TaxID=1798371 RepID=A0A1F5YQ85_9BACT|nr:MAG: hypothetical protein A2W14_02585 [Candidatus Gottesmanbacteria bacterium RBG_16_37_8]
MKLAKFIKLFKNKKYLIIGIIVILILISVIIFQNSASKKDKTRSAYKNLPLLIDINPTPTLSPDLESAIVEAKQSAQEYDDWQANLRLTYPWLRKLPVASEKYYVYFDLKQEKFLGSLYPGKGDNPANIKAEALRVLKEVKEIPIENYQFQWRVK